MSLGSNRRADRTNRVVLTVVGLLAVIAGGAGLVASYVVDDSGPVVTAGQRSWLLDHATIMAIAAAAVTLIVLILALLWLRHQLRPIAEAHDTTVTHHDDGSTVLRTSAFTDAVEAELIELRGVAAASARIRSADPDTIDVLLDVDDSASIPQVAGQVASQVLPRARRASSNDALGFALECRPVLTPPAPRVA